MPRRRPSLRRNEILAFVLAGLLALAVVALSGWGAESETATEVETVDPMAPIVSPSVDP